MVLRCSLSHVCRSAVTVLYVKPLSARVITDCTFFGCQHCARHSAPEGDTAAEGKALHVHVKKAYAWVKLQLEACEMFGNFVSFYGEELLAPRPNFKLGDRPLSALRDCLLNTLATTLLIGGRSSLRNQRTWHAVVTEPTYHGRNCYYSTLYYYCYYYYTYLLHGADSFLRSHLV